MNSSKNDYSLTAEKIKAPTIVEPLLAKVVQKKSLSLQTAINKTVDDELKSLNAMIQTAATALNTSAFEAFKSSQINLASVMQESMLPNIHSALTAISNIPAYETLNSIGSALQAVVSQSTFFDSLHYINKSAISALCPQLETIATSFNKIGSVYAAPTTRIDYQLASDLIQLGHAISRQDLESIPECDLNEFETDIQSICDEQGSYVTFEQKIYFVIKKWMEKRPIIALLLAFVLTYLGTKTLDFVWAYIAKSIVQVKEQPMKDSKPLDKLKKGTLVQIVENVKYYHKVIYVHEEAQSQRGGWVAKRNLTKYNV